VVKLRVPAGVPAMWVEHAGGDPAAHGVLLLGRGLSWTPSRVVRAPDRTFVFDFVEGPRNPEGLPRLPRADEVGIRSDAAPRQKRASQVFSVARR
jgi:hypothetical protein